MFGRPAAPATPETPASELPDNDPIDDHDEDNFQD
jgi:hypothetical protein